MSAAVLRVVNLALAFPVRRGLWGGRAALLALAGVDFELRAPEALGVVGESGSGKSTLARAILQLIRPSAGRILWDGEDTGNFSRAARRGLHEKLQIVFQNPLASLDPRMTVEEIIAEPLRVHRAALTQAARAHQVAGALARVGLGQELASRYPHELSGGQCQRVAIARAMILAPRLLVCDEAVSALDVSIQAQIIDLLLALRAEEGLALLFISHNLAVVRKLCDRVLVLYLGRMMELAPAEALYTAPLHPYTRGLIEAILIPDPQLQPARLAHLMPGEPPSALTPPPGCVFQTRCAHAIAVCRSEVPAWESAGDGRHVACHRWRELAERQA
jgi:oligopeptide transport system ATP-binding protein